MANPPKASIPDAIEFVRNIEGPCRKADRIIAEALGLKHGPDGGWCNSENGDYWTVQECALPFTSSIDAALTLLKPDWSIQLWINQANCHKEEPRWNCASMETDSYYYEGHGYTGEVEAPNAAIGLCIAALEASHTSQ